MSNESNDRAEAERAETEWDEFIEWQAKRFRQLGALLPSPTPVQEPHEEDLA